MSHTLNDPSSAAQAAPSEAAYSKPPEGLFCLLGPGGRLVVNPDGQACCFASQAAADRFLESHPELGPEAQVQEVFVKGEVHGWEQVSAEDVDERSLRELADSAE